MEKTLHPELRRHARHGHGVCRSCFDLYAHGRRGRSERCHACASGSRRSDGERTAIRTFWIQNPTRSHLVAFAVWGNERDLERARRNLDRFWRRAHRWSAHTSGTAR
ncbi:MAG: hypothetical protein U0610_10315 [bacterium]